MEAKWKQIKHFTVYIKMYIKLNLRIIIINVDTYKGEL